MAANELYILPTDVQLIPVTQLGEQTKEKFEYDEKDYVITYLHSRNTSRVIDEGSATLLEEFRDPKSLVQGVLNYSVNHQLDPQEILDESYYFLAQLRKEGFLIPYTDQDTRDTGNYKEILAPGQPFKDYEIVKKIQEISDTRVYMIRNNAGRPFALKLLTTDGKADRLAAHFHNETTILQHLDAKVNPALIEQGEYEGNAYMILEWVEGVPCLTAAEQYRPFIDPGNIDAVLTLTGNILNAYAQLHAQGVIHADIHPGNILVGPGNTVKIIDFGLARQAAAPAKDPRGGMGFFYEPEYAQAALAGTRPPLATYEGEQYSLAALLYQMITGRQYLDFSFEKQELWRQIAHDTPVPFSKYDLDLDPEIEDTLLQALSKQPADRHTSLEAFAEKWRTLRPRDLRQPHQPHQPHQPFTAFADGLIRKFGWNGRFIDAGLQQSPTSSINYGAAGIAYLFHRLSCLRENADLLALADVWADRAGAFAGKEDTAFYAKEIDITPATVGQSSLYHTAAGIHCVQSLISSTMGNYYSLRTSLDGYLKEASQPCENPDLTLGQSGILLGCALIWENCTHSYTPDQKEELRITGDRLMEEIWTLLDTYPPLHQKENKIYFGIAHGWAGFLYATLRWSMASGKTLPANFYTRVDQLLGQTLTEGQQMRWPITATEPVSWPGWCHGSAGYTFLWTALYQKTGDQKFITTAEKAANHFCAGTPPANGSLCCGTAGEAYALLNLYKVTTDPAWLKKAKNLAHHAWQHINAPSLQANSLYKGEIGIGILLAEIEQPAYARMPFFE